MGVQLEKSAIDLGIVITDSEKSLGFYRDLLGYEHVADIPMPLGGGTMHRLQCGETLIKLIKYDTNPERRGDGGISASTGMRYFTMIISNLTEMMADCEAAGVEVAVPITTVRAGVTIGIVYDPDGNAVEFVENS
jgi:catechol 2,3-dioxygenase-like lactoylglutathione lyase family enzyme